MKKGPLATFADMTPTSAPKPNDWQSKSGAKELPPELSIYREHTVALLRRYFCLSVEMGRLPSMLGREFFRARVSSYRMSTFEDGVIFVHDMERCLDKLDVIARQLVARIVFQEYTAEETAAMLQCTRRTVVRRYMDTLDQLSEVFLSTGVLRGFASGSRATHKNEAVPARTDLFACADAGECKRKAPRSETLWRHVNPLQRGISRQATLVKGDIIFANVSHFPPPA